MVCCDVIFIFIISSSYPIADSWWLCDGWMDGWMVVGWDVGMDGWVDEEGIE